MFIKEEEYGSTTVEIRLQRDDLVDDNLPPYFLEKPGETIPSALEDQSHIPSKSIGDNRAVGIFYRENGSSRGTTQKYKGTSIRNMHLLPVEVIINRLKGGEIPNGLSLKSAELEFRQVAELNQEFEAVFGHRASTLQPRRVVKFQQIDGKKPESFYYDQICRSNLSPSHRLWAQSVLTDEHLSRPAQLVSEVPGRDWRINHILSMLALPGYPDFEMHPFFYIDELLGSQRGLIGSFCGGLAMIEQKGLPIDHIVRTVYTAISDSYIDEKDLPHGFELPQERITLDNYDEIMDRIRSQEVGEAIARRAIRQVTKTIAFAHATGWRFSPSKRVGGSGLPRNVSIGTHETGLIINDGVTIQRNHTPEELRNLLIRDIREFNLTFAGLGLLLSDNRDFNSQIPDIFREVYIDTLDQLGQHDFVDEFCTAIQDQRVTDIQDLMFN